MEPPLVNSGRAADQYAVYQPLGKRGTIMCKLLVVSRKIICSAAILLLLLSVALPVQAAGWHKGQKEGLSQQSGEMMEGRIGFLQKANELVGTQVQNNNNEKIGTVKELIIDNNQRTVSYIIISSERNLHPVSWSAFDTSGKTLMLNITKDKLMQGPSIESILSTLSRFPPCGQEAPSEKLPTG